ncbi:hypothetical protein [Kaarinaea lacus]
MYNETWDLVNTTVIRQNKMSYDQFLYKSEPDVGPMNKWDKDYSLAIGSPEEIRKMFEEILGELKWNYTKDGGYWAEGCCTKHGFEISVSGQGANIVRLVGCSQEQAKEMATKLGLSAFDPQKGEQIVL